MNELVQRVSVLDEIHIPGEEAEIIVLPMFHSFGLCLGVHMAICNSARLIPMMQFDAKLFNKLMRKNLVVGVMGIPSMFQKLMKEKHFDGPWLKNIRLMFCGGDDVSEKFLNEFNSYFEKWGAVGRLRQGYGLTEVASVCCTNTNTDNRKGSIGKALDGVRIEIWDDDHKKLPTGEIGEIVVSGPTAISLRTVRMISVFTPMKTEINGFSRVTSVIRMKTAISSSQAERKDLLSFPAIMSTPTTLKRRSASLTSSKRSVPFRAGKATRA